ncbi:MAG: tRNA(fMet)-specific endonuclease VapC [Pseudomonadota bacterium]|nr:tRNA(fMet)-specific endonuclease VapC [Pseudomonadota bacterium]
MARLTYLLDTNILSEPIAARPNPDVLAKIKAHESLIAIAAITWQELLYGMFLLPAGKRRDQIEDYLFRCIRPALPILAFEEQAAHWQATECVRLRQIGKRPSYPDSQIAAIAAVNDCVLVTRNVTDFANFQGLPIENWFEDDNVLENP